MINDQDRRRRGSIAWVAALPGGERGRRVASRASVLALLLCGVLTSRADVFFPLASYEAGETDLRVEANAGDPGLSVAIVEGGVSGAPAATDGTRLLKVTITNEADRKIEFRHFWNSTWYDLADNSALLMDFYIASPGVVPGVLGVWSSNWDPPSPWQPASNLPTLVGGWTTVVIPLQGRQQKVLDALWAVVVENLAGTSGVIYVDNLRLRRPGGPLAPTGIAANGYTDGNHVLWKPSNVQQLDGYHVYRATAASPYVRLTPAPIAVPAYHDAGAAGGPGYYYKVSAVVAGVESPLSSIAYARYNGLTDDELLDTVQQAAFRYFWDDAHPLCGLAREGLGFGHPLDTVTTGGTGFGLATIVVGAERGFVTRAAAALRVRTMLRFLDETVQRYHGAWAHHYNGVTGATIPFSSYQDNGGDIVETAFLVEGLLIVRLYFNNPDDPVETEIRDRATAMWEGVNWNAYRKDGGPLLYWNWSPDYGFAINVPVVGYNETQVAYVLAVASPTYPIPAACYHNGWAGGGWYVNGQTFFGYHQAVGPWLGGPTFFTHYSNIGLDPRYKHDAYANYFENARAITLINRAYCAANRYGYKSYNALCWGITPSADPGGYWPHTPTDDNGTLAPTAAVSALPYAPDVVLPTIRHLYDAYGAYLWGPDGFYDAFNATQNWVGQGYLAIDQGPMAPMIENHRTGLCWKLFMRNPEIVPALHAIGMYCEVDFDTDGQVDAADAATFADCLAGPDNGAAPGCDPQTFALADLDNDADVDLVDAAVVQELFTGP